MPGSVLCLDAWPNLEPICGSGLGSSLFKLAAIDDAQRRGFVCDLLTSSAKVALLESSPSIRRVASDPHAVELSAYSQRVCLGLERPPVAEHFRGDLRARAVVKEQYNKLPHLKYWRGLLARSLGYPPPEEPARFPLPPTAEAVRWWDAQRPPGRYVLLSVSALSALKLYRRWAEVAARLVAALPDLTVVLVGKGLGGAGPCERVVDLTHRTTLPQLLPIVAAAQLVAGTDGLITNLAMAAGRPTVPLFSIIQPEFVVDPEQALRAPVWPLVQSGCPLQFCYPQLKNYRSDPCPADPELPADAAPVCMRFPVSVVVEAIRAGLSG